VASPSTSIAIKVDEEVSISNSTATPRLNFYAHEPLQTLEGEG